MVFSVAANTEGGNAYEYTGRTVVREYMSERTSIWKDSKYAQVLRKVVDEKECLLPNLTPELRKAIDELMDVQMEAAVIAERDAFVMGFRLATQIIVDSLTAPPVSTP